MIYDIIIVGGGIAGLYTAYKITKLYPNLTFLILEKNSRKYIGGRMINYKFKGINVNTGAGVGRKEKDILLIKLLEELNVSYTSSTTNVNYSTTINKVNINDIFEMLKKKI